MRTVFLLAILLTLGLVGCGGTGTTVEPGDGPAATAEPEPTDPEVTEGDPPMEGEGKPCEEPTEEAEAAPASFDEKYTYPDGLEVEVIKIVNGKFTGSRRSTPLRRPATRTPSSQCG